MQTPAHDDAGPQTPTLAEVEALADAYAARRRALSETAAEAAAEIAVVRRRFRKRLLSRASRVRDARAALEDVLRRAAHLFERPRSRVFSSVRVGWRKLPARIDVPDEERTIAGIRRRFRGGDLDRYLRVRTSVLRTALRALPAQVLRALGCTVVDGTDEPVIVPTDDAALENLVAALLDEH